MFSRRPSRATTSLLPPLWSLPRFNFGQPVLGQTTVSFAAFDPTAPSQYIEQWSLFDRKEPRHSRPRWKSDISESHGLHLQRSHLINNAPPGPGAIGPRRPFRTLSFLPGTELPPNMTVVSTTFPVSGINLLENSAQSWYDAGYVNVRRRYCGWLDLSGQLHLVQEPDAMRPTSARRCSSLPSRRTTATLPRRKGPACDIRHRFALSAVYDIPALDGSRAVARADSRTGGCRLSTRHRAASRSPFRCSATRPIQGRCLARIPIRANYTGQPVFGPGTRTADRWFNPAAFATPAAFTFGNVGRNTVYGPGLQTLDMALAPRVRLDRTTPVPVPRRVFQRAQPHESRHAKPLRQHAAVRHHHRSGDAGPRNSIQRAGFVLGLHIRQASGPFLSLKRPGLRFFHI